MVASHHEDLKWLFSELLSECRRVHNSTIVSEFLGLLNDEDRRHLLQSLFGQALVTREWWLAEACLSFGFPISPPQECADGPLHVAMYYCGDAPDVVGWMLNHGADIERRDWAQANTTPLIHASVLGLSGVVELLLERGADPNASTEIDNDDTALTLAAKTGNRRVVELLLAYGAQVGRRNRWGQDAAELARSAGHEEVYNLLGEKLLSASHVASRRGTQKS